MSGSFALSKRKVKNCSLSRSPSSNSISPSTTTTTGFKPRNFKKIGVDLTEPSGDKCSAPSSNTKLALAKKVSKANLSTSHDESPQSSQCWRKKPGSVNRSYNRNSHSNYAAVGCQMLDSSVSKPEFRPYDICFHGRRNHAFIGATLPGENKGSRIEIQEEWTKGSVLRPGMVLLKNFLSHDEQVGYCFVIPFKILHFTATNRTRRYILEIS